jgi:C-terminal processing protease CtpA/Prc
MSSRLLGKALPQFRWAGSAAHAASGHVYGAFEPRGKEPGALGTEPLQRWSRPVAVVQGEGNYSDANIFPYAFQRLGLGKLVGAPVAGTGTAVWWERQIDPTLVFGIPQVGIRTPEGVYPENLDLVPDELVLNTPEDVAAGLDRQLERAVDVLLEELTK